MNPFANATVRDSSQQEVEALEQICERLQGFDDQLSLEWVDGFLTALAAGPRLPEQAEWLQAMAGDAIDRCFADPADRELAERALATRLRVLGAQLDPEALLAQPEKLRLSPLMVWWSDEDRAEALQRVQAQVSSDPGQAEAVEGLDPHAYLQTGLIWAGGVLAAVEAFEAGWQPQASGEVSSPATSVAQAEGDEPTPIDDLLQFTFLLAMPVGSIEYQALYKELFGTEVLDREDLISTAAMALQETKLLWLERAPKPIQRRVEAKPGRNDPCHCGSGKKHKKCHGLQEG